MKSLTIESTQVLVLGLLTIGAAAVCLAPPSTAEACSPPSDEVSFLLGATSHVPIAREGVAVIGTITAFDAAEVTVQVFDAESGIEVPGAVEQIPFGFDAAQLESNVTYVRALHVWRATGTFDPERTYRVELSSGPTEETAMGVVAAADHAGPPTPDGALFEANRYNRSRYDCMVSDGVGFCNTCTATDEYQEVVLRWAVPVDAEDPFVTYGIALEGGGAASAWQAGGATARMAIANLGRSERAEEYCLAVTATSLIDGTTSTTERFCVLDAEIPEIEEPDAGLVDGGVDGGADADGGVDGGAAPAAGGCSVGTTQNANWPTAALLFAAVLLVHIRRRA